jgi:hypothetical protein
MWPKQPPQEFGNREFKTYYKEYSLGSVPQWIHCLFCYLIFNTAGNGYEYKIIIFTQTLFIIRTRINPITWSASLSPNTSVPFF